MKILEEVRNWNFDNGVFDLRNGCWVKFSNSIFTLENENEVITLNSLEELKEYSFLFL